MNIIIPMAGYGSRFATCGFTLPKPLINVAGKAMYRHAVDCLPLELATNLIFILREDMHTNDLIKDIETHYTQETYKRSIVMTYEPPQGQAETVLNSISVWNLNHPTLIHNCDTYISDNIPWRELAQKDTDGILVLFTSQEPRWSYAKVDDVKNRITDVQEKKVISSHASTGTYFFKSSPDLIKNIQKIMQEGKRENGEYYLSTVYRIMLEQKKNLLPVWCEEMLCFGTPPDLVDSLNKMLVNNFKDSCI